MSCPFQPKNNNNGHRCLFEKRLLTVRSLIVKNQQNRIELVTRHAIIQAYLELVFRSVGFAGPPQSLYHRLQQLLAFGRQKVLRRTNPQLWLAEPRESWWRCLLFWGPSLACTCQKKVRVSPLPLWLSTLPSYPFWFHIKITHFKYQNCRGTQSKQTSDPIRQSKAGRKLNLMFPLRGD